MDCLRSIAEPFQDRNSEESWRVFDLQEGMTPK